jgi:hypothetical protein
MVPTPPRVRDLKKTGFNLNGTKFERRLVPNTPKSRNPKPIMPDTTNSEIPAVLAARLAHPTVRLSGAIDEAAAASYRCELAARG